MKFSGFNKDLADEVANLFATLGNDSTRAESGRLDSEVCVMELLERVKHLDVSAPSEPSE